GAEAIAAYRLIPAMACLAIHVIAVIKCFPAGNAPSLTIAAASTLETAVLEEFGGGLGKGMDCGENAEKGNQGEEKPCFHTKTSFQLPGNAFRSTLTRG